MIADEAAFKSWPVLVEISRARATMTYSDLAARIGTGKRSLSRPLGLIQEICLKGGMPPLSILAVLKNARVPSSGFTAWDIDDAATGMEAVYAYEWGDENPFEYARAGQGIKELTRKLLRNPGRAEDIYELVKARGAAQAIFRQAVLVAYQGRCAVCGTTFEACIEAAHLIPWVEALPAQRIDPRNGVCLCVFHHRLFDQGCITIDALSKVRYFEKPSKSYTKADRAMSTDLDGKPAYLPALKDLRPSAEALNHHYAQHGWDVSPWDLAAE